MSAVIADNLTITTMPLSKLRRSQLNVRRKKVDVSDLKASIKNHGGLIQNLVITLAEDGFGEVVAGGCRLEALQALVNDGDFDKHAPISVKVVQLADALAISTAENVIRQDMTTVEKFYAYKAQVDAGRTVEQVAEAFNVSVNSIRRHMALASAAPAVIEALDGGKISLAAAEAICFSQDHAVQASVLKSHGHWSAPSIMRMMMEQNLHENDPIVRFVGVDAYVAAGGKITMSLFVGEDGGQVIEDAALMRSLALSKLQAIAEPYSQAGYVTVVRDPEDTRYYRTADDLLKMGQDKITLMIDSTAALEAVAAYSKADQAVDEAEELLESIDPVDNPDADEAAKISLGAAEAALKAVHAHALEELRNPEAIKPEYRKHVTYTIALENGECTIKSSVRDDFDPANHPLGEEVTGQAQEKGATRNVSTTDSASLSARLKSKLSAHRNAGLQLAVAANPTMAKALLIQSLLTHVSFAESDKPWEVCRPVALTANITTGAKADDWNGFAGAGSDYPLQPLRDRLANLLTGLPTEFADALQFLAGLDASVTDEVMAILTALLTHSHFNSPRNQKAIHEAFAVNLSETFQPNIGNYFGGLNREQIISDLKEAGVAGDESDIAKLRAMKTKELAAEASSRVDGTGWVPKGITIA